MGAFNFTQEDPATSSGATAFAEKGDADGKDTAIFLPPGISFPGGKANVVVWFHGYYVQSVRDLIHPANTKMDMKLRESVVAAGKDVIFVAPWLGLKTSSTSGTISLGPLGEADGGQTFLQGVLDGVLRFQNARSSQSIASLTLGNLVLAGHSAGGAQMRAASKHFGSFQENLKECWGFDCFYDDLYTAWCNENPTWLKIFYFGNGSGGAGSYAFKMMKQVYGTPKKPLADADRLPKVRVAPAVDRIATANDDIAFESIADVLDWNPIGPNIYTNIRKATDPLLDDPDQSRYWKAMYPKLTDHFQVVRDLLGPRIKQSGAL